MNNINCDTDNNQQKNEGKSNNNNDSCRIDSGITPVLNSFSLTTFRKNGLKDKENIEKVIESIIN